MIAGALLLSLGESPGFFFRAANKGPRVEIRQNHAKRCDPLGIRAR
jgi:hypothetical protein